MNAAFRRAEEFAQQFGLKIPILLAPMAGSCPPSLSIAIANAGGLGGCGALRMTPVAIMDWAREVRSHSNGAFQMNLWIPDLPPVRDAEREARLRAFLERWGPHVPADMAEPGQFDFDAQCEALLACEAPVVSSIMGLYPAPFVRQLKAKGVAWFATVTTVAEARAAVEAGADVIVAQGSEAGGHRGAFEPERAERQLVGLFALLPAVVDAVDVPVVATGGIADARGITAALALGASAVQIGTGFLRCPEAKLHPVWAEQLGRTKPEDTAVTRAFTGRAARGVANAFVVAANGPDAPTAMAYPLQRDLTAAMRDDAARQGDAERMQLWAGQSAALAKALPAGDLARALWSQAVEGP
ncbi:MAG: nitronate monooxygenase [Novosphingobium sp.]|nr:nitronate monooxygenase [Novosphingobium sp.]